MNVTFVLYTCILIRILLYGVQTSLGEVEMFSYFLFLNIVLSVCFSEREQSINRAGIVQENIQPPGILDS